jgi:GNAT superfamily N-acetyltransferase
MFVLNRLRKEHVKDVINCVHHVDEFQTTDSQDQWSEEELSAWLSHPNDFCVGVYSGDHLVGYSLSHWHQETNKVHIENVFVKKHFRRQGVATLLMNATRDFYRARTDNRIRLAGVIRSDNASAQLFFEQDGFNKGLEMIWYQKDVYSNEA